MDKMNSELSDTFEKKEYKEYPYRFLIITLYLLTSLVNQLPVNTFSATTTIVQKNFDIPAGLITLNYLICPISHTICAAPVNWMLTKKGIKLSYYIATVMMIAGLWFRTTLTSSNPYLCLLGSFLCGSSGLFIMNSASKITQNWFRTQVLTIITFLSVLGSFVSMASGLIVPGILLNAESNADDFLYYLRFQAILVSVPFILLVIFIKEKPETPPSRAAEAQHDTNKQRKYRHLMKALFKNPNYLKLAGSMALTFGVMVAYISVLDRGLKGLGYEQRGKLISNIVIVALISGIIGTWFYSVMIKKTKKYKLFSLVLTFGFFVGFLILILGQFYGLRQTWKISLTSILFGFNYFSEASLFVVYGSQLAFPVDQASVAGYLIVIAQTFGFLLGLILLTLFNGTRQNTIIIFSVLAGLQFLGALLSTTITEDLRKQRFEEALLSQTPEIEAESQENPESEDLKNGENNGLQLE